MQYVHRLITTTALVALAVPASADTNIYTSSESFLATLSSSFTETFDNLSNLASGAISFSSGSYSYNIFAATDLFANGSNLQSSLPDDAITINFTSGNINSVGANFYGVNLSDAFQSTAITVTLSDGTTTTFTPNSASDSYRGFSSSLSITSLTISGPGTAMYAVLDNLTVGVSAVPEPSSFALLGLGLAGIALARRRHQA